MEGTTELSGTFNDFFCRGLRVCKLSLTHLQVVSCFYDKGSVGVPAGCNWGSCVRSLRSYTHVRNYHRRHKGGPKRKLYPYPLL